MLRRGQSGVRLPRLRKAIPRNTASRSGKMLRERRSKRGVSDAQPDPVRVRAGSEG